MEAQNLKEDAKDVLNHASDYAETFYKLSLLRLTKKISDIASGVVNSVLIFFISLCILLFISFAGAWWLGDVVNNRAVGFLLIAAFYILLVFILILMRKKVISPFIRNTLISKIYEEKNKVVRGS
ncbi:MAG TPA: phage holin family protein [Chitinophagaceae bacterium]|nr:phage holin family protein [Chitinophagaceae bacterium]